MSETYGEIAGAHDPYAALRLRDFRLYLTGSILANIGLMMQTTAIGWDLYKKTGRPITLGYVGLVQVLPVALLMLPAGHMADRFDRRKIILIAQSLMFAAALGLALSWWFQAQLWAIYLCLFLTGVARAFQQPARAAFLPQIVPSDKFSNAVTWSSTGWQISSIGGPALAGGIMYLFDTTMPIYFIDAGAVLVLLIAVLMIKPPPFVPSGQAATVESLMAGIRFVWRTKVILASITLDLFAVLLGGAVALLPVYAIDILHLSNVGYGLLRAASAIGALVMAMVLAHQPPMKQAGKALLWAVAGFGVATVAFGISRDPVLSFAMLFLTGAFDNISVVVRHTLVQIMTPDHMRGRVSAVNGLFIGMSNELGDLESGFVAELCKSRWGTDIGTTVTVVGGGIGTILIVAASAVIWPQLRRVRKLDDHAHVAA